MMSQTNENAANPETTLVNTADSGKNVVSTISLRNVLVSRSLRQTGPLRISIPQEISLELQQQLETQFYALTPEEENQIHLAARRIAPHFFRERYRNYGDE
ncbi:MAG: hypothetical protein M1596_02925 [Firmicutes bacterium]|nr:hypothetical protein [Bacillota bacterium]